MNRRVYYTRVSIGLVAFIVAGFSLPTLLAMGDVVVTVVNIALLVAVLVFMFTIRYVIEGEKLKIYVAFWAQTIDIKTITRIESSQSVLSSPASSLDRIAIHYGKRHVAYISPRNQEDFIATLSQIGNFETRIG